MALGFSNTARYDRALNNFYTTNDNDQQETVISDNQANSINRTVSFKTQKQENSKEDENESSNTVVVKSKHDRQEVRFYGDVIEDTFSINPTTNQTSDIPKGTRVLCSHPITKKMMNGKNLELLTVYGIDRETTKIEISQLCISSVDLTNDRKTIFVNNFKF